MTTPLHSILKKPTIVYRVDPRGQIRAQQYTAGVTTPDHRWPELKTLYNEQDFAEGYLVFLAFLEAVANGAKATLPDEWLPAKVLALRAADAAPKVWEAPPLPGKVTPKAAARARKSAP